MSKTINATKNRTKRIQYSFPFFQTVLGFVIRRLFHYRYDVIPKIDGPILLLCNHTTEFDPMFVGLATRNPVRFVASEHIMRKGFGTWFLQTFFAPIIHRKGKDGAKSAMHMLRCLKDGESVMMFPEGNRTFNGVTMEIPEATGKLAKRSGATLVTYRLEGGFFMQPRFSVKRRKGYVKGHLVNILGPEVLAAMTVFEITDAIRRDLHEDAYATNQKVNASFTGKNLAEGIESTLYYCPECHAFGSLKGVRNQLQCTCGKMVTYDKKGRLVGGRQLETLYEWDELQKKALREYVLESSTEKIIFSDTVIVREISEQHQAGEAKEGLLKVSQESLFLDEKEYAWSEVKGLSIYSRNNISLFLGDSYRHLDIRGNVSFNALKYLYFYQFLKEDQVQ